MAQGFAASVGDWCATVKEAQEAIFKESAQELVHQLDDLLSDLVYSTPSMQRTGFLRASLVASKSAMPALTRDNPGAAVPPPDYGEVMLTINGTDLGEPLYLGYTASYGGFIHYGTAKMAGRPWVDLVAQRWVQIVEQKEAAVRSRFGL